MSLLDSNYSYAIVLGYIAGLSPSGSDVAGCGLANDSVISQLCDLGQIAPLALSSLFAHLLNKGDYSPLTH